MHAQCKQILSAYYHVKKNISWPKLPQNLSDLKLQIRSDGIRRSAARTSATRTFPSRLSRLDISLPRTFPTPEFSHPNNENILTRNLFRILRVRMRVLRFEVLYLQYFFACAVRIVGVFT